MVASSGACLAGAVTARNLRAIVPSLIMFVSMFDTVLWHQIPPAVWSGLLLVASFVIISELRAVRITNPIAKTHPEATPHSPDARQERRRLLVMIPTYVTMAWLVLVHSHGDSNIHTATGHAHHAGPGLAPILTVAWLLATISTIQAIASARQHQFWSAVESAAMAAMLASMLIPFLGVW